jgi:predicted alpha/beta-hydrolase family hydrolase
LFIEHILWLFVTKAKLSSEIDGVVKKATADNLVVEDYTACFLNGVLMHTLINGEGNLYTCILAHGAGAPMDSSFMNDFACGLAENGVRVVRFEFPYMQERRLNGKKRPPNRQPELIECFLEVLAKELGPCVIAGKSMGGRMASILASQENSPAHVKGVLAVGYPFHPQGKPEKLRTDHLPSIQVPMLVQQGSRDALGNSELVGSLGLPENIRIDWLEDGNHDLKPRVKSGYTHEQHVQLAIKNSAQFIKQCLQGE